tara:strand:- start:481 stop:1152 length:672 start_codon:yes stop_codon:yes gene_type:complete
MDVITRGFKSVIARKNAGGGGGGPAYIEQVAAYQTAGGGNTIALDLTAGISAGDAVLVAIHCLIDVTSVTDSVGGNTWTEALFHDATENDDIHFFYSVLTNALADTDTVTINLAADTFVRKIVTAVSASGVSGIDVTADRVRAFTTDFTDSATTTGETLIFGAADWDSGTVSANVNSTTISTVAQSGNVYGSFYFESPSGGSLSSGLTLSGNTNGSVAWVSFN